MLRRAGSQTRPAPSLCGHSVTFATIARPVTSPCVGHWLRQARAIPLLTPAEELHLARLVQRGQRAEANRADLRVAARARRRMIAANLRLVVTIAKPFRHRLWVTCLQFEDLLQEGCLGLARAVDKFDPEAGYKFSTYAFFWVRQAIGHALEIHAGGARLPARLTRQLARLSQQTVADPGGGILLDAARCLLNPVSLEAPVRGRETLRLVDQLADASSSQVLEQLDFQAAMQSLVASGVDLRPLYRVTVGRESMSSLSRERGVSKQALSQRIKRDRARLAVVASPYRNLISEAG